MKFKLKNKISSINKNMGFTLIETLVAVFILTISLAALLNLVSTSLSSFKYSRDDVTANYLIQEVVDSIRNKRDSMAFLGGSWDNFLKHYGFIDNKNTACFAVGSGCNFDVLSEQKNLNNKVYGCPVYNKPEKHKLYCFNLNIISDGDDSYYTPYKTDGVESNFRRQINMSQIKDGFGKGVGVNIKVSVEWETENGAVRIRELEFTLMNWR